MDEIARQCTATSHQTHERCRKSAMNGQQVCHFHGGKSPGALRRAQEKLLALAEPAIEVLNRALESNGPITALEISAARTALDRVPGLGPRASLVLQRPDDEEDLSDMTLDSAIEEMERMLNDLKRQRDLKVEQEGIRITLRERRAFSSNGENDMLLAARNPQLAAPHAPLVIDGEEVDAPLGEDEQEL